jgi:Brp/Blh family beta-carotene 15,15'-monooxygenase
MFINLFKTFFAKINLVVFLSITLILLSLLSQIAAEWLAIALIFFAGIPHGAFDIRIARMKWQANNKYFLVNNPLGIALIYFLIGLLMSAFCLVFPTTGLLIFILISILHFGEAENKYLGSYWGFLVGCTSILSPITFHPNQALGYLTFFISEENFQWIISYLFPLNILFLVILLSRIIWILKSNQVYAQSLKLPLGFIPELLLCLFSWVVLPPLAGFSVWFIGRHSLDHFSSCRTLFLSHNQEQNKNNFLSNKWISFDFLVLSGVAMILILPLTYWFNLSDIKQLFAASIILIAGLTLPHMIVTSRITT